MAIGSSPPDLDLDPMTYVLKLDPAIVVQGFQKLEHYRQTDRHTDRSTENITTPHSKKAEDQDEQEMFQKCDLCYTVQMRNTVNTEETHLGLLTVGYHDGVGYFCNIPVSYTHLTLPTIYSV